MSNWDTLKALGCYGLFILLWVGAFVISIGLPILAIWALIKYLGS